MEEGFLVWTGYLRTKYLARDPATQIISSQLDAFTRGFLGGSGGLQVMGAVSFVKADG